MSNIYESKIFKLTFNSNGVNRNIIPDTSLISTKPGAASYVDGFPPDTMKAKKVGGIPPWGQDFNGIFNDITGALQWMQTGSKYLYNTDLSNNINAYPKGSRVSRSDRDGDWIKLNGVSRNSPEEDDGTNWRPEENANVTNILMSNANVTLLPLQAANGIIVITGVLTSNLNLIFPTYLMKWIVVNKTTGGYQINAKTESGSGVILPECSTIYCDGQSIYYTNPIATKANDPTFADDSTKTASTGWVRSGLSAIARAAGFEIVTGRTGYIKLPLWLGGLVIQWGESAFTAIPSVELKEIPLLYTYKLSNFWGLCEATDVQYGGKGTRCCSEVGTLNMFKFNCSGVGPGPLQTSIRYISIGI